MKSIFFAFSLLFMGVAHAEVVQDPMRLACAGIQGSSPGFSVCEEVAKHPMTVVYNQAPQAGVTREEYMELNRKLDTLSVRVYELSSKLNSK